MSSCLSVNLAWFSFTNVLRDEGKPNMLIMIINVSSLKSLSIYHSSVSEQPLFEEVQQPMDIRQRSSLNPQNFQAASGDSKLKVRTVKYIDQIYNSIYFRPKEELPERMNEKCYEGQAVFKKSS